MTSQQAPLGSGFGVTSTASEVMTGIDLTDHVAVVTGGASGIGAEVAREFAAAGATVVVPARDVGRARVTLAGLDGVEIEAMDLMEPASIDSVTARFVRSGRPLHLLVLSAGIGGAPLARDGRGFESHFATNHLGHFQLVAGLMPALRRANRARVVAVSSWAHRASDIVFDDPNYERREYDPITAYGQSKTANNLFAVALDTRAQSDRIRAFSLHPGTVVDTNFKRHAPLPVLEAVGMIDEHGEGVLDPTKGWKSIPQGAATTVWCATSPALAGLGGQYAQDCDLAPLLDHTDPAVVARANSFGPAALGVMDYSLDPEAAARLWTVSRGLTGVAD